MTSATILKDSINSFGNRVTTFRLTYTRYILAELNTFRMASKNTASSRAIPVTKNIERIRENPFVPTEWGKNRPGMSANELINENLINEAKKTWIKASQLNCAVAEKLNSLNIHKQIVNRVLEPYSTVDTILTATDFDNFFKLRIDKQADPEIHRLARLMYEEYSNSKPELLLTNQWHLPYIDCDYSDVNNKRYFVDNTEIDLETAIKVSVSCCAQVSYRKLDTSVDKALDIFEKLRLFDSESIPHSSPTEHQCKPFSNKEYEVRMNAYNMMYESLNGEVNINEKELSELESIFYKRNFRGWTQYRVSIPNDTFKNKFILDE